MVGHSTMAVAAPLSTRIAKAAQQRKASGKNRSFLRPLDVALAISKASKRAPYVDLASLMETQIGRRLLAAWEPPGNPEKAWVRILRNTRLHELADVLRFHPDGYTRRRVAHTTEAEVMLMCWLPGQGTAVHDHGKISARVFLVAGRALETEFSPLDHTKVVRKRNLRAGDEFREVPGGIHRVECVGKNPLVTLHLNSPPLKTMHRYSDVAPKYR